MIEFMHARVEGAVPVAISRNPVTERLSRRQLIDHLAKVGDDRRAGMG
jgi:hypothetical protein